MASLKTTGIVISWGAVLGWMGLIFYISQQPSVAASAISLPILRHLPIWTLQWVYHGTAFAGLSVLTFYALRATFPWSWYAVGVIAFLFSVGYGVTDEWHQSFVRGRSADIADIGRDAIGAFLIIVLAHLSTVVAKRLFQTLLNRRSE